MKVKSLRIKIQEIPFALVKGEDCRQAVILFPEAFGFTGHIQDVATRLAREGFDVFIYDFYHRDASFLSIPYPDKILREKMMQKLNTNSLTEDLEKIYPYFSKYDKVFSLGFSIGGYASLLMASLFPLSGSVAYYPNPLMEKKDLPFSPLRDSLKVLKCESLIFFAEEDYSISRLEVHQVKEYLISGSLNHEVKVFKGANHGFFCNSRRSYQKETAASSWKSVTSWLNER